MMREAAKIGPAAAAPVEAIMRAKPHPEQGRGTDPRGKAAAHKCQVHRTLKSAVDIRTVEELAGKQRGPDLSLSFIVAYRL